MNRRLEPFSLGTSLGPLQLRSEVGPSCGLTKDHCCSGALGPKGGAESGPRDLPLRSLSTGQTCRADKYTANTH